MKRLILITLGSILIFGTSSNAAPKVFIEHGDAFDFQCSQFVNDNGVSTDSTKKVVELLPRIQSAWNKNGSTLLEGIEKVTSRKFKRTELSVTLITCKVVIAVSHPTVVNMLPFLRMGVDESETILIDTIFHELAHRFLDEHYFAVLDINNKNASKLIRKYSDEGPVVLAHLHLFALTKAAYLSLGKGEDWKKAESFLRDIGEPNYIKALDIVAKEGEAAFVNELQ